MVFRVFAGTFGLFACAAAATAGAGTATMTDYVGSYSFDEVEGVAFLDHPAVRKAVTDNAPADLQKTLLMPAVTVPIAESNGMIVYTACQTRNCDGQNWVIALAKDGSKAAICHFDKTHPSDAAWYADQAKLIPVTGTCPSNRQPAIAVKVIVHVTGVDPWADAIEG